MRQWSDLTIQEKIAIKMSCEASFLYFFKAMNEFVFNSDVNINWHHRLIAKEIQEMILRKDGNAPSLVINVPPGSGKTEFFSVFAPAWAHVRTKQLRLLSMSYSKVLVERNSERVKLLMKSTPFQEMWPCAFAKDRMDEWRVLMSNHVKTEFLSASMSGQATGTRAGLNGDGYTGSLNIDDPDKPEDMFSKTKREKNHRIMINTVSSRRMFTRDDNQTPIILIQQRVHVQDCTGFILAGGLGKNFKYKHIIVPALIDQDYIDTLDDDIKHYCIRDICGTKQVNGCWSYWPFKEGVESLFDRREANEYSFMSQYMQRPIALGGNMIKVEKIKYYAADSNAYDDAITSDGKNVRVLLCDLPTPPTFSRRFITADTALKDTELSDYSVFCHWGIWQDVLYLLDMDRGKMEAPELRRRFKAFAEMAWSMNSYSKGTLSKILVEDKASGTGLIQELGGKLPIPITPVPRSRDKVSRAHGAVPMIEAGRVALPWNKPWVLDVTAEMAEFKGDMTHKHDDICDNLFDAVEEGLLIGSAAESMWASILS